MSPVLSRQQPTPFQPLQRRDRGQQLADPLGELRSRRRVVVDREPFASAKPVGEFFRDEVERIATLGGGADAGSSARGLAAFMPRTPRTRTSAPGRP